MKSGKIVILGGGPGGYSAAFSAARKGFEVTLVEQDKVGGTCLNSGCVPTKTIKASTEALHLAKRMKEFGIDYDGNVKPNIEAIINRKSKVCNTLRGGLEKTCKQLGVTLIQGHGEFLDNRTIEITPIDGVGYQIKADKIIIATGSRTLQLPNIPFDHTCVISSDDALECTKIPDEMIILGGGVIGCEMAGIFAELGSKVTVVEGQDRLLPIPGIDESISALLLKEFKKKKIKVHLNRTLEDLVVENNRASCTLKDSPFNPPAKPGKDIPLSAETVLVTVGRTPNSDNIGLSKAGVTVDERGWIKVDEFLETDSPGIYGIGDILGPANYMLAHMATMEGLHVVEGISGNIQPMKYRVVPSAIFTSPEIGCVGLSENEAKLAGFETETETLQMRVLGKSQAMSELSGLCKIVADKKTDKVLGIHIASAHATDILAESTLAIKKNLSITDLTQTIHAHPTLAEGIFEAALAMKERKENI